jgi:hypothetical protein
MHGTALVLCSMNFMYIIFEDAARGMWVPVNTTEWRVLSLRMQERPPDTEGSCEYIE